MDRALVDLVWRRAGHACEYCRLPYEFSEIAFQLDHALPLSHGGLTESANLCLACFPCNCFKGTNLAGIDPRTKKLAALFNPRRHKWNTHFRWHGPVLIGRTPTGRATVVTLRINAAYRIAQRQELIDERLFPPE